MRAHIGVGANLGDRPGQCRAAIEAVDRLPNSRVLGRSPFYRTQPVGVEGQDWFLNAAIALATDLSARRLMESLLEIEALLGRVRKGLQDARPIDLDLLLCGEQVLREPGLTVPHPRMHLRRFVLVPLAELDPQLRHPVLGKTVLELLQELPAEGQSVLPWEAK
jgi:2-amino-4-hydroxy-6-hydroxymethyldihydropteridine diphosphokinase